MLAPAKSSMPTPALTRSKRANIDPELEADAIAYFQSASAWSQTSRRLDTRLHLD